jgi:hypothetical protein
MATYQRFTRGINSPALERIPEFPRQSARLTLTSTPRISYRPVFHMLMTSR